MKLLIVKEVLKVKHYLIVYKKDKYNYGGKIINAENHEEALKLLKENEGKEIEIISINEREIMA